MIEDEARGKRCPIHQNACLAAGCMMWRWHPLPADDAFADAVRRAATELRDNSSNRIRAVRHVNAHRAQYGLATQPISGYCGLAGEEAVASLSSVASSREVPPAPEPAPAAQAAPRVPRVQRVRS